MDVAIYLPLGTIVLIQHSNQYIFCKNIKEPQVKKDLTTVAWVVWGVGTNVSDLKLLNQINSYLSEQSSSWLQSQLFLAHYNRSKLKTDSSQNQKNKKTFNQEKKGRMKKWMQLDFLQPHIKHPIATKFLFFTVLISIEK